MDSSNYHCPHCNSENISSVSLVYKRGHVYGYSTDLAKEVAPPEKPQRPESGCIMCLVYFIAFICALPIICWIIGYLFFDKPREEVIEALSNLGQALILPILLWGLAKVVHRINVKRYEREMQEWKRKYDEWVKQYICMRCGHIFSME